MALQCPKCKTVLEVRLTAAPPMQAESAKSSGSIGEMLADIDMDSLNPWETEFVTKLKERYEQYGERVMLSDKQRGILEKIAHGE